MGNKIQVAELVSTIHDDAMTTSGLPRFDAEVEAVRKKLAIYLDHEANLENELTDVRAKIKSAQNFISEFGSDSMTPEPQRLWPEDQEYFWVPRFGSIAYQILVPLQQHPEGMTFKEITAAIIPGDITKNQRENLRSGVKTLFERGWLDHPDRLTYRLKSEYLV